MAGNSVQFASPQAEKLALVHQARRIATDHQDPVILVLHSFLDTLSVSWEEFVVRFEDRMLQVSGAGEPESPQVRCSGDNKRPQETRLDGLIDSRCHVVKFYTIPLTDECKEMDL